MEKKPVREVMGATLLSHDFYVKGEAHLCAERGWLRGNLSAAPTAIIGQKRKVQFILPGVSRVTPRAIGRCARHFSSKRLKLIQDFVIERHLITTDRTPICRIERQNDGASGEIGQRNCLIGGGVEAEVGRLAGGRKRVRHKLIL